MLGPSIDGRSLPITALEYGSTIVSHSTRPESQVLRSLLQKSDDLFCDSETEVVDGIFKYFSGTSEEFFLLQQHCCPSFFTFSSRGRIEVAANIAYISTDIDVHLPQTLRTVIGGDVRKIHISDLENTGADTSLLHYVMGQIGKCRAEMQRTGCLNDVSILLDSCIKQDERSKELLSLSQDWNRLLCDLLDTGLNCHFIWSDQSPFVTFLLEYFDHWEYERREIRDLNLAVQSWMRDLKVLGIDLHEFGRKETEVWENDAMEREWGCNYLWKRRQSPRHWRLIGFQYGPCPEDWSVWMYEWNESFTDFWNLVERPIESMPGAWPGE